MQSCMTAVWLKLQPPVEWTNKNKYVCSMWNELIYYFECSDYYFRLGDAMKGFDRQNQLFSLCGLNCALCPMFLNKNCPGCGGGEGNQSCKIARCSMEHDNTQYCFQCKEYPCEKYDHIDDFDSFITHQNRRSDMERAKQFGIDAYNTEQAEKAKILETFLSNYNDGRKKTFFCVAVNLLELQDLRNVIEQIKGNSEIEILPLKERSSFVSGLLQEEAATKNIDLKLHRKKR